MRSWSRNEMLIISSSNSQFGRGGWRQTLDPENVQDHHCCYKQQLESIRLRKMRHNLKVQGHLLHPKALLCQEQLQTRNSNSSVAYCPFHELRLHPVYESSWSKCGLCHPHR